jgi:hypothetical protein
MNAVNLVRVEKINDERKLVTKIQAFNSHL